MAHISIFPSCHSPVFIIGYINMGPQGVHVLRRTIPECRFSAAKRGFNRSMIIPKYYLSGSSINVWMVFGCIWEDG